MEIGSMNFPSVLCFFFIIEERVWETKKRKLSKNESKTLPFWAGMCIRKRCKKENPKKIKGIENKKTNDSENAQMLHCDIASNASVLQKNHIQNAHSHSNPLLDTHLSNVLNKIQLTLCRCLSTVAFTVSLALLCVNCLY